MRFPMLEGSGEAPQSRRQDGQLWQGGASVAPGDAEGDSTESPHRAGGEATVVAATAEQLRTVRVNLAAATAVLPITPEMAWAVPQLLKRVRPFSPESHTTTGVLRSLVRRPTLDPLFAQAFEESGFLSCDKVMERARWKYHLDAMLARERSAGTAHVLRHCTAVLAEHGGPSAFDWEAVLAQFQMLRVWFPDLHTVALLEQLYVRLSALHRGSVQVAQLWLDQHAAHQGALFAGPGRTPGAIALRG